MTTGIGKWMVPVAGFVLGLLIAAALLATQGPLQAAIAFVIVAGYGMVVWRAPVQVGRGEPAHGPAAR